MNAPPLREPGCGSGYGLAIVKLSPKQRAERDRDFRAVVDYAAACDLEPNEIEYLFRLQFPNGMTASEIGQALGISRQAVNQILYRAEAKLRKNRTLRELGRD